jgi:hypothetical protein
VLGLVLTLLVPVARRPPELRLTIIEPTPSVAARAIQGVELQLNIAPGSPVL